MSKIIIDEEGITLISEELTFFRALYYGLYDALLEVTQQ